MGYLAQDSTIFIVDEDDAVRDSLQTLFEVSGFATESYASGLDFLNACDGTEIGCVLLDVVMPKMSGLQVLAELDAGRSNLAVIMITGTEDATIASRAIKLGASDVMAKPCRGGELLEGIDQALSFQESAQLRAETKTRVQRNLQRLTPRETHVLDALVNGKPTREIADELDCSVRTVGIHQSRVMEKMRAYSLPQLMRMAFISEMETAND